MTKIAIVRAKVGPNKMMQFGPHRAQTMRRCVETTLVPSVRDSCCADKKDMNIKMAAKVKNNIR